MESFPNDRSSYPGRQMVCTVKSVHNEGVAVSLELDGQIVNGTISPRCYGKTLEGRTDAMSTIKVGDKILAVIRSYHAPTRSASLLLPGCESLPPKHKSASPFVHASMKAEARLTKPTFMPEPMDTIYVWDFTNVISYLPRTAIPYAKSAIEKVFPQSIFMFDRKAIAYWAHNMTSDSAADVFFKNFREGSNGTYIGASKKRSEAARSRDDADCAILATVSALENGRAVSRDCYLDMQQAFPDAVENRLRTFSVACLPNGGAVLTLENAAKAVVIPPYVEETSACATSDKVTA